MSKRPLTFLTGSTGFVGAALARTLSVQGHALRLLVRPGNDRRNLTGLENIELVEGDLTRPETYREAMIGCDALFHAAADYRIWVPDPANMHKINVDGTRQLMETALLTGVKRIIYTSSVATRGIRKDGVPADEETPVTFADMVGVYKRSKYLAEQEVLRLINDEGLPCVIVSPSTPVGPRDIKPTPTGRIIVEAALGKIPAFVDTGLNIAHVDDVANGHFLAYQHGKIGENYILGGENLGLGDILAIVAKQVKRPPPTLKLPRALLFPLAYCVESSARRSGKDPFITLDGLRMSKKKMFFSHEKATKELGYKPRSSTSAIADAIRWFQSSGYC